MSGCCTNSTMLPIGPTGPAGSSANDSWLLLGNTGTTPGTDFLGTLDSVDLVVKTNSTEQLRITASGLFGFNNPAPDYFLDGIQDIDDYCAFELYNPNTGTAAGLRVYLNSPLAATALEQYNQNYVTSTFRFQNGGALISTGVGGLSLAASNASGDIRFYTGGSTAKAYLLSTGKFGIGVSPTAFLDVLGTTEQVRVRYDNSNYYTTTVSSTGVVTYNAVGSSAGFQFLNAVSVGSASNTYGYLLDIATVNGLDFIVRRNTIGAVSINTTQAAQNRLSVFHHSTVGQEDVRIVGGTGTTYFNHNGGFTIGDSSNVYGYKLDVRGTNGYDFIVRRSTNIGVVSIDSSGAALNLLSIFHPTVLSQEEARIAGGTGTTYFNHNGNVAIGSTTADASAILDIRSTTKGLRLPNMTTGQKNAISAPAAGLMVYDTTLGKACLYTTAWETITSV